MKKPSLAIFSIFLFAVLLLPSFASASYVVALHFVIEKPVYSANEQIVLTGSLTQSNRSANDTSFAAVPDASVNITIFDNSTGAVKGNYNPNTSSDGSFRSNSSSNLSSTTILAPAEAGTYVIEASYKDADNSAWYTRTGFTVMSQVIDEIIIRSSKSKYYASETVTVYLEAVRKSGDYRIPVSNVSLNGSLRYESLAVISRFGCTTGDNGVCSISLSAPATAGKYIIEAQNFLSASSFRVVAFNAQVYMKDGLGQSFKEIFRTGDDASVEVMVDVNGSAPTGTYTFSGSITDSSGGTVTTITATTLESNNSYTNRFTFTISNQFTAGNYFATVNVYDSSSNSRSATVSFQVRDWTLNFYKASSASGFESEYTTFPNRALNFEIYPKDRQNGTIITGLNWTQFNITLKDMMGSVMSIGNASWNSSCGTSGCYIFNLTSPSSTGNYMVSVSLNHSSDTQKTERKITVTSLTVSALPTTETGQQKDLFGTTEYVYIKLTATNTTSSVNITDASLISITYENGTEFSYANTTWGGVNVTDTVFQWAWNATEQKIRLDPPKSGGMYTAKIGANLDTVITATTFIINPYDVCAAAKSTAGSVDSSTSFYVWQYKTSDTVYFEMKMVQANNPAGRANSSVGKNASFGMGSACNIDTTKQQVVNNATITIQKVFNSISGVANALNTTESVCKSDDNQGKYTCTLKPLTRWESGRNIVEFNVLSSDRQTTDKVIAIFESRNFFVYGYPTTWANKPQSNISFTLYLYMPGTGWWSNYGSGGLSGSASIEKVQYFGKSGEWVWPPVEIAYNKTGLNSTTVTSGSATFALQHTRVPNSAWDVGSYSVIVKATDSASGESDYGEVYFEIKKWDVYTSPVEISGSNFNYKYSFNTRENISLYTRITNAGDWNDNGGTPLGGNVTIKAKKLQQYSSGPSKEVNTSTYGSSTINVNATSPWSWTGNANNYANYVLTLYPANGKWESGYYNAVLDVNGTDTGWGWFNVISFNVETKPTDVNGTNYIYSTKGKTPVYFNVTLAKSWKSQYTNDDYVNATFEDMTIRTWRQVGGTWQTFEYNYPEDINVSIVGTETKQINGSALFNVSLASGNWPTGWYNGDMKLRSVAGDSIGDSATGYPYFNIQPFRVQSSTSSYQIDYDKNVTATLDIYEPDWSSSTLITGNYSIKGITETQWTGGGSSVTTYTAYTPRNFTGSTSLNISPSGTTANNKWSLANNGYHYLTLTIEDIDAGATQDAWLYFRAMPMLVSIGTPSNQYAISSMQNVTVPVTITSSSNNSASTANITRVSEWSWPTRTDYSFTVGSCSSTTSGSCRISGTQNVVIHTPSGGWTEGWHYPEFEFSPPDDSASRITAGSAWFQVTQPYTGEFSNYDESWNWKYYFGMTENASIKLAVRDSNSAAQAVNITKVQYAESGSNCWTDYCRNYVDANWEIINASQSLPNQTATHGSVIKIIKPASGWQRGEHVVKVNVAGPAGSGTLKSGYFWAKDSTAPNVTITSPVFNSTINTSTLQFSATTTESTVCGVWLVNYNSYYSWYCGWVSTNTTNTTNSTNTSAYPSYMASSIRVCNNTLFNGSSYYYNWANKWSAATLVTDGTTHSYTFIIGSVPVQHYALYTWCDDPDWNYAFGATVFKINNSVAALDSLNVTLLAPANYSAASSKNPSFSFNLTTYNTTNCTLYGNFTGTYQANATNNSLAAGINYIAPSPPLNLRNGTYMWNVRCVSNLDSSIVGLAPANFNFRVNNSDVVASGNQITGMAARTSKLFTAIIDFIVGFLKSLVGG